MQVDDEKVLNIAGNLSSFRKTSQLQSTVLAFISGLMVSSEELEDLKQVFLKMDTNRDGTLCMEEIREGMKQYMDPFYYE